MKNFEYREKQYKNAAPLYIVLAWAIVTNIIDGVNLYLEKVPIGSTDAADRIMLIFMLIFFISAIHLKFPHESVPVGDLLYRNLPAILLGFSLATFFFSVFPFYIALLIGSSGFFLYLERNAR